MMKTSAVAALAAALSLTSSRSAHADELDADVEVEDVSYRGHIVASDGVAVALMIGALATDNEGLADASLVTAGLGAPMVHLAHGNPGRAVGSLALRAGATFGGLALGAAVCDSGGSSEGFECLGPVLIGGALGYGAAAIIDAAVLGHQTRTVRPLPVAPRLAMSRDSVQLGIGGSF